MLSWLKTNRMLYEEALEVLRKATHADASLMQQCLMYERHSSPAGLDKMIAHFHSLLAEYAAEYSKDAAKPEVLAQLAVRISIADEAMVNLRFRLEKHRNCLLELRPIIERAIGGVKAFESKWQTSAGRDAVTRAETMVTEMKAAEQADTEALSRKGLLSDAAMDRDLQARWMEALRNRGSYSPRSRSDSYRSWQDYGGGTSVSTMGGGAC